MFRKLFVLVLVTLFVAVPVSAEKQAVDKKSAETQAENKAARKELKQKIVEHLLRNQRTPAIILYQDAYQVGTAKAAAEITRIYTKIKAGKKIVLPPFPKVAKSEKSTDPKTMLEKSKVGAESEIRSEIKKEEKPTAAQKPEFHG